MKLKPRYEREDFEVLVQNCLDCTETRKNSSSEVTPNDFICCFHLLLLFGSNAVYTRPLVHLQVTRWRCICPLSNLMKHFPRILQIGLNFGAIFLSHRFNECVSLAVVACVDPLMCSVRAYLDLVRTSHSPSTFHLNGSVGCTFDALYNQTKTKTYAFSTNCFQCSAVAAADSRCE